MTYRMMAELATDLACKKLGIDKKCETATTPLPGSETSVLTEKTSKTSYEYSQRVMEGRHGTMTSHIRQQAIEDKALVCECENVTVGEVKFAVEQLHVHHIINLRRRTRLGMGTCQGELCACRGANVLCEVGSTPAQKGMQDLTAFMAERWKGMRPVAWGDTLNEAQLTGMIYESLCGFNRVADEKKEVAK